MKKRLANFIARVRAALAYEDFTTTISPKDDDPFSALEAERIAMEHAISAAVRMIVVQKQLWAQLVSALDDHGNVVYVSISAEREYSDKLAELKAAMMVVNNLSEESAELLSQIESEQ